MFQEGKDVHSTVKSNQRPSLDTQGEIERENSKRAFAQQLEAESYESKHSKCDSQSRSGTNPVCRTSLSGGLSGGDS